MRSTGSPPADVIGELDAASASWHAIGKVIWVRGPRVRQRREKRLLADPKFTVRELARECALANGTVRRDKYQ